MLLLKAASIIMDETNEEVPVVTEVEEEQEIEPATENTDWSARAKKLEEAAIVQRERTRAMKAELAKLKAQAPKAEAPSKSGELDETALDYLDLKGITEDEDIKVVEGIVKKTGMTVRQALKDDYVVKKLEANKAAREVSAATPSATKRSGSGSTNDLALAIAEYEQSGFTKLPSDFKLRSAVVNAMVDKQSRNKPTWH